MSGEYYGHKTYADGTHEPMSKDEAKALWERVEAEDARRRDAIPDTQAALQTMFDACTRLKDEGWKEGRQCPKDGTPFAFVTLWSTGIFSGAYSGEWPHGYVIGCDCVHHPGELIWKPLDKLTDAERARMEKCMVDEIAMADRMMRAFSTGQ